MELNIQVCFSIETESGFKIHPKVIELLKEVNKTGSLNAAVGNLGMSYSYAWNLINKTNCQLESPIIESRRGGNGGGVARLTLIGKELLKYCSMLEKGFSDFTNTHKLRL